MKPELRTAILAAIFLAATPAVAGDTPHSQQDKLSRCANDSKGLKGGERSKFMSECLKGHDAHPGDKAKAHPAGEKPATVKEARHDAAHAEGQQGRMKACNDEARRKDLHGDERRAFMSACLKSHD